MMMMMVMVMIMMMIMRQNVISWKLDFIVTLLIGRFHMNMNMTYKKLFSAGQCPYPLLKEMLLLCVLELEVYLDLKGLEASLLWLSLML